MPKQTTAQSLGRLGERWFQAALPRELLFTRPSEDFGIDGVVTVGNTTEVTSTEFGVQVKTSRRWSMKGGAIIVPGIPIETLRYWAGRLLPTLLVLYEADTDTGYFAWVADLITQSDLAKLQRTTSLRVSRQDVLHMDTWPAIRRRAETYHRELASAFATLSDARPILRTIRALAQSLRLLGLPHDSETSEEDSMLRQLGDVVGHREVIASLRALAATLSEAHVLQTRLRDAADTYRTICASFLHPFDELLRGADRAVAIWVNEEQMLRGRPQLISIIADLLVGLSTLAVPEFSLSHRNKAVNPSGGSGRS